MPGVPGNPDGHPHPVPGDVGVLPHPPGCDMPGGMPEPISFSPATLVPAIDRRSSAPADAQIVYLIVKGAMISPFAS
jgi:hypothetical protein